jgi:hypothetical protein
MNGKRRQNKKKAETILIWLPPGASIGGNYSVTVTLDRPTGLSIGLPFAPASSMAKI